MATTLFSLPPELLANIFYHLEDSSFFSARLANRALEQASFSLFGKRFFRKKGYMITTPSLKVLQSVASHEKLRRYVQHVWFNPDCYTYGEPGSTALIRVEDVHILRETPPYSEEVAKGRGNYLRSVAMHDNQMLLNGNGKLSDSLKSAFATLPNLKTVGMRRSDQHSPWGWSQLMYDVGKDPRELGDISNPVDSGFKTMPGPTMLYLSLIYALGTSGARVQRLYTDAVQVDAIPVYPLPPTVIQEACKSLLYLEINVTEGDWLTHRFLMDDDNDPHDRMSEHRGAGLVKLLSACPNLRELGLMIFPGIHNSHLVPPEGGWSKSYMFLVLKHLADSVQLCNLRRIKLEKFTTMPSTLISLLRPSAPQLTSIKLRDIRLLEEHDEDRSWRSIFAFLAASCPKLSYLLLYHLYHASGGIRFVQHLPSHPPSQYEDDPDLVISTENFTDYENISVEVGTPHSDPGVESPERRAAIFRARETVGDRVRALVNGHWYGQNLFSYEMDEMLWHTDTSDEEW